MREPELVSDVIDARCTLHPECQDKGDYVLPAQCSNCGWSGTIIQTRGHRLRYMGADCPYCGCPKVDALPQWAGKRGPAG